MDHPTHTFLTALDMNEDTLRRNVATALDGADDGDLFLETTRQQSLSFENGRVKSTSFSEAMGMGLRRVVGDFAALVHSNQLSAAQLKKASDDLRHISGGSNTSTNFRLPPALAPLYPAVNPLDGHSLNERIRLMEQVDHYVRQKDNRVVQVLVSFTTHLQQVMVVQFGGAIATDTRPLVRMDVQVILDNGKTRESGHFGFGTRNVDDILFNPAQWQHAANEAFRQAEAMLEAQPAPGGEMPVVLGAGWSGVLFHEAVGHGLEGDFNRKGTSAFAGMVGQQVAAKGVTVVDDGTIPNRRGSLTIDDEGTPPEKTVLIEDGVLRGYMQDRMNARLMGSNPTGNGRRQSYAHMPMPRMTNTYLLAGNTPAADIIAGTKQGIYAKNFGGGQVDITTGSFVFEVSEAYLIENGKITTPVKGATLIGNGPKALHYIDMIGNDMALDNGIGTCGKDGQSVPVGVGQPTLRLNGGITVGGTV